MHSLLPLSPQSAGRRYASEDKLGYEREESTDAGRRRRVSRRARTGLDTAAILRICPAWHTGCSLTPQQMWRTGLGGSGGMSDRAGGTAGRVVFFETDSREQTYFGEALGP